MTRRTLNRLSAKEAERLKTPGRHSDGGGLYLSIDGDGRRRWVFLYVRRGRRVELGLGGGRDMALASARTEAAALRAMLANGEDPKAARARNDSVPTFGECADAYVEAMHASWRNAKHAAQWRMTLKTYAKPIRDRLVDDITTQDVLDILQPLWTRVPETAKRLSGRIENVLDAAKGRGQRSGENPARWRGHLDQLLPKRRRLPRGHHAALAYDDIPTFMAELRVRPAVAARALEFAILTACRTCEIVGAVWEEIDFEKQLWRIPASRMKAAKEHRGSVSEQIPEMTRGCVHCFRVSRGRTVAAAVIRGTQMRAGFDDLAGNFDLRLAGVVAPFSGMQHAFATSGACLADHQSAVHSHTLPIMS